MQFKATLTAEQADLNERPYNTTLRVPPDLWGDGDDYQPDGFPLDFDNVEAIVRDPDARAKYGFSLFAVHQIIEGSCLQSVVGRYVWFAGEEHPQEIDSVQVHRMIGCLERHGFTDRFAYGKETKIDASQNCRTFSDWVMGPPPGYSPLERSCAIDLPVWFLQISADEGDAA